MKSSSAKAKGRRLQDSVCKQLLEHYDGRLEEGDIRPAIMGESGEDIKQSPLARKVLPFSIECKNQEKLSIWSALKQAETNCPDGQFPALAFKRNHSDIYFTMKFNDLLKLIKELKSLDKTVS